MHSLEGRCIVDADQGIDGVRDGAVTKIAWVLGFVLLAALTMLGAAHGVPRPDYAPSTEQNAWLNPQTVFHPDEFAYVGIPYRMLLRHEWNPHYYHNPSLNLYTNLAFFVVTDAGSLPHNATYGDREIAPFVLYFSARILSALYTLLAVVLTYLTGRVAFNRTAGVVAALMVGASPLMVQHAHYATPNAETTLLATAAAAWAICIVYDRLPRRMPHWFVYAVAGGLVGLTMAARYNAAVVGVVTGLALLTDAWQRRQMLPLVAGAVAMPLGFALGMPGIVLATQEVLDQIQGILEWYRAGGGPGFTAAHGPESFYYHWRYVALVAIGPAGTLAAVAGLALTWRARRVQWRTAWVGIVMALYMAIYTPVALKGTRIQANLLFPVLLPVALLVGYAVSRLWQHWPQRWVRIVSLLAVVGWPLVLTLLFTYRITTLDNRLRAQAWVYDHVPRGSSVYLLEPYNVPLDPLDYSTVQTYAHQATADEVRQSTAQIIIYSDTLSFLALRDPALSDTADRAYEQDIQDVLASEWIELIRFERMPWPAENLSPDDVSYWHQMEIVVYCNPADCPVDRMRSGG